MLAEAPPVMAFPPGAGGPAERHAVGTNIDCTAFSQGDGRFELRVRIEETTIYAEYGDQNHTPENVPGAQHPVFRSFRSVNTVILKDGGSARFTTATDRISGETVQAEVTLTVLP